MDTRREFLKKAMVMSGAAGLSGAMPSSIQRALAIDPDPESTFLDAEHVVLLMQENRSFDHCFGTLQGVRGFNDPRAMTQPDGNKVWVQKDSEGDAYAPFRFDIQRSRVTWMGSLPHLRSDQVAAFNDGKHDQWLNAKRSFDKKFANMPLTLGHFSRDDIPFHYAMADAFTICDQHFCSAQTSTWPNRLFFFTGGVRAKKTGIARSYMNNYIPWGENYLESFPELLEQNGISWKVYQNELSTGGGYVGEESSWLSNFGCNTLEFLSQYNTRFHPRYHQSLEKRAALLTDQLAALEKKRRAMTSNDSGYEKLQREISIKQQVLQDTNNQLAEWNPDNFSKLTPQQKNLFHKAFTTNAGDPDYHSLETLQFEDAGVQRKVQIPKGDVLYQFRKDVENGNLPTVSWLAPPQNFSDHPSAPWYGVWFTSEILDILTKNPAVWKKTIFILTYDENDGYFDHIPPFVAPDRLDKATGKCSSGVNETDEDYTRKDHLMNYGWTKKEAQTAPVGLGYRVPMIIASPWSRGGKVCSQVFDHTSNLQFLEYFLNAKYKKNIRMDRISSWRRTVCGNLTAAFSQFDPKKEKLPFLKKDPSIQRIYNARFTEKPAGFKKLTREDIDVINSNPVSSPFMSHQEEGVRPACPLPYQLYANGAMERDGRGFRLTMQTKKDAFGEAAAGSPFKVYALNKYVARGYDEAEKPIFETGRSWDFAVSAGDALSAHWPLDSFEDRSYHLSVHGPNGFYREFTGNADDPQLDIICDYERNRLFKNKLTGNVELFIHNKSNMPYQVKITDNAYKHKPISRTVAASKQIAVLLDLKKDQGWYDFTVSVPGKNVFSKRYAGRTETGKESITDPVMGAGV